MDKIYFIRNSIKNNTISHGYITNFINIPILIIVKIKMECL